MKTYAVKKEDIQRDWHLVDARGRVLGELATEVAGLLMGKNKVKFSRHLDVGDNVVVINAAHVKVTGNKKQDKYYYRHSGYPGGFKAESLEKVLEKQPQRVIEHAVRGMLPRNKLGESMIGKLRVYAGEEHPHGAQLKPKPSEQA